MEHIPHRLNKFELPTFFTYSTKERALIKARHRHLSRFALGLRIGIEPKRRRTLDARPYVPRNFRKESREIGSSMKSPLYFSPRTV